MQRSHLEDGQSAARFPAGADDDQTGLRAAGPAVSRCALVSRRGLCRVFMLLLPIWAGAQMPAAADEQRPASPPPPPQPEPDAEGFRELFDGRSLQGFRVVGDGATFSVRDGMIVATPLPRRGTTYLRTVDDDYRNFILDVEFSVEGQINSGIQIRSQLQPFGERERVVGYQVEIDPSERAWTGGIFDEGRRGWLVKLNDNEPARQAFKPNDWNQLRIICQGERIRTQLNGVSAAELKDALSPVGFIALQVRASATAGGTSRDRTGLSPPVERIRWRSLRLKPLDDER